jgi:Fe-S-cluster containining protein
VSDDELIEAPDSGRSFPLRRHQLAFIPDLHVGEEVFTARFDRDADSSRCSARCCRAGVLVDIAHRDRILAEAPLVHEYMEPAQEHDPTKWFFAEDEEDVDFPSGRAINTTLVGGTCVFLDSQRRCVLQRAEEKSPGLKPFYCRAFPIVIVEGRLTLNCDHCPDDTQCCGIVPPPQGERTALDVFRFELTHTLGAEGVRELERTRTAWEQTDPSAT